MNSGAVAASVFVMTGNFTQQERINFLIVSGVLLGVMLVPIFLYYAYRWCNK